MNEEELKKLRQFSFLGKDYEIINKDPQNLYYFYKIYFENLDISLYVSEYNCSSISDEKKYYASISDCKGVIPETEENCSWGFIAESTAQKAVDSAIKEFFKTYNFVLKVGNKLKEFHNV